MQYSAQQISRRVYTLSSVGITVKDDERSNRTGISQHDLVAVQEAAGSVFESSEVTSSMSEMLAYAG